MDLVFKSEEAERLAHEIRQRTGESLEETVTNALRDYDRKTLRRNPAEIAARLLEISRDWRSAPRIDARHPDDILYDAEGAPRQRDKGDDFSTTDLASAL